MSSRRLVSVVGCLVVVASAFALRHVPFFVTAHELAHQWWAHQVVGGNVQGSTILSETFSQYSAAMVMEKTFGQETTARLLRYEGRGYLISRSTESKREWPLALNENQGYIHYNKGLLVMYALKEAVGDGRRRRCAARSS